MSDHAGCVKAVMVKASLCRGADPIPVASFLTDCSTPYALQFNRAGTHFAWGAIDGTVILCEIAATQAKLAEVMLGW